MRSRVADATAREAGSKPQRANTEYFSTSRTGGTGARRQGQRVWRLALVTLTLTTLALASFGLASPSPARAAATTSTTDITKCDYTTLSSAVANAASGDTLQFGCDGIISFAAKFDATFTINKTLTIDGNGHKVTLDGGGHRQLFVVQKSGNLTLDGLTVTRGHSSYGGGAMILGGTLTIKDSTFSGNWVTSSGDTAAGGGVHNAGGTLTIDHSTFSGNSATDVSNDFGGGVSSYGGALTITNSAFSDNSSDNSSGNKAENLYRSANGGGVYHTGGALTITNSTFSGNSAKSAYGSATGGGVYHTGGALTITNSTFSGDSAWSDSNATANGGGVYHTGGALTITNSTFSGNLAHLIGGGLYNSGDTVTITNSSFNRNSAGGGGGVWKEDGELRITNSTFLGNLANRNYAWGGAVASTTSTASKTSIVSITNSAFIANASTGESKHGSYGGAVYSSSNTRLSITNSTFTANVAGISTGPAADPISDVLSFLSAFTVGVDANGPTGSVNIGQFLSGIRNIFRSGNYTSDGYGGAVFNDQGDVTITNSTISGNLTVGGEGQSGGVHTYGATASTTIKNSIVAANSAATGVMANCNVPVTDGGYNMTDWNGECGFTSDKHDVWTASADFESLGNNGGPTPTLTLLRNSLAVDQIPRGVNGCGASGQTDQRGYTRPQGNKCDIGAVELDNAPPITTASLSPKANGTYTADVKVTLSRGNDAGGSGVKATYYKLDNGGQQTYSAPFTITSAGQHTLTYWSVDNAGNAEIAKVMTIKIDKTPYLLYIGIGLAGLVIVGLIVALVFWRRKRRSGGASGEESGGARGEGGGGSGAPLDEPRVPVLR